MSLKALATFSAAFFAAASFAQAAVVINIYAGTLSTGGGIAIPANSLIQLVNIGDDGFDPINVADANVSGLNRWVSGNDLVLDIPFQAFDGTLHAGDFNSTSHFDLGYNAAGANGILDRTFSFATGALPTGTKLGIRWFPGLTIDSDADFNAITLQTGQAYGQYTLQAPTLPLHGGSVWVGPADESFQFFDSLTTVSVENGDQPNSLGQATFSVIPEPTAIGLSLLGAAGLATLRRRRG